MAELLIYDKNNWMDAMTAEHIAERIEQEPKFKHKYASRFQPGDIIEVRPDGYWMGPKARGFNQAAFRVLAIKGEKAEILKDFESEWNDENGLPIYRRKYRTGIGSGHKIYTVKNLAEAQIESK